MSGMAMATGEKLNGEWEWKVMMVNGKSWRVRGRDTAVGVVGVVGVVAAGEVETVAAAPQENRVQTTRTPRAGAGSGT